jgi:hypothetical protein
MRNGAGGVGDVNGCEAEVQGGGVPRAVELQVGGGE